MAPKKTGAANARPPAVPELYDDDVEASDDDFEGIVDEDLSDADMEGLEAGEGDDELGAGGDDEETGDEEMEDGDDDDDLVDDAARLKAAARRQMPAGPGPMSAAAAAAKSGGIVADTALMLHTDASDAAILQMEADELLAETRVTYGKNSDVEAVVSRLKQALMSMPEHEVSMGIARGFVEALGLKAEDSLTIKPPAAVTVVGSYAARAVARPETTVDIAVQLPNDFIAPKAHLNYRYHARRAVYLVAVARHLRDLSYSLYGEQRLQALHGDPTRPVLVLQPPKAGGFSLRLLPTIAPSIFALPRLAPDRNGVRAHCKPVPATASAASGAGSTDAVEQTQKQQQQQQEAQLLPTPHYNAGILEDMLLPVHAARLKSVLASSPCLLDGLLLLKVWARQHGLYCTASGSSSASSSSSSAAIAGTTAAATGAAGSLDGCVLAMLVLLLAERNKMTSSMSVLQVFRASLQLLADSSVWSKGLVMGRLEASAGSKEAAALKEAVAQHTPPSLQSFKAVHQVVFVDFTGWLNVAAHMTRGSLAHAQLLARRTLDLLTAPADPDEAFAAALLTPLSSPAAAFDYHWRVSLPGSTGAGATLWPWKVAKGAAAAGTAAEASQEDGTGGGSLCRDRVLWREQEAQIEQLVRQALTDRAKVVRVVRRPLSSSCVPEDLEHGLIPLAGTSASSDSAAASAAVWVGAVADPLAAGRLVDVGPAADDGPAAARFRRFWGDKSELRRWQDGKITETAVWEVPPHTRHSIPDLILSHLVSRHLPPGSSVSGAASSLDWSLTCKTSPPGADLAASRAAEAAVEKLGKQLRALDGLALKVIGVQPLSAVTRGTAPLPPQPHPLAGGSAASAAGIGGGGSGSGGGIPRCLDPMEVLVTLENSGRWPDDALAFRKMKAALGLQLASSLAASYGHHVSASEEAVDVLLDGFAFRLVLYSGRDEAMLTKAANAAAGAAPTGAAAASGGGGVGLVSSSQLSPEESPLLLTWHHGLIALVGGGNAAYAPAARLAGRWVAAHMMSNHVAPQAVELLVAAAFGGAGQPAGTPAPGSRVTGFLRFLQLLARWPWSLRPLVVDPAGELREADRRAIRSRFEARRAAGEAPALYICTPRDRESRHWTHRGPSSAALQRLSVLAARSAALLQLLLQPTAAAHNHAAPSSTPSGLPAEWPAVFATPAADFDAFILLRKEALPHADLALPTPSTPHGSNKGKHAATVARGSKQGDGAEAAIATLLLPPGSAVRDLLQPAVPGGPIAALDGPASVPDALSYTLEDAGPSEPPPKRARAFLRCFPDNVVAAKGAARLQPELLVGFDPVSRLLTELAAGYGHLATFCVDGLGGRFVGVRWAPDAFLPQPLRLNTAHTALQLVLTAVEEDEEEGAAAKSSGGKAAARLCVPNVFAVLREVKELGLGLVEDVVMPPSSAKARAAW